MRHTLRRVTKKTEIKVSKLEEEEVSFVSTSNEGRSKSPELKLSPLHSRRFLNELFFIR